MTRKSSCDGFKERGGDVYHEGNIVFLPKIVQTSMLMKLELYQRYEE
jgi:hypothetical protein